MRHKCPARPLLHSRGRIRRGRTTMNLRTTHATFLLALLGTAAHGADVYRSTAPDGTVSYSDRPQGADAQFVFSAATRPARRGPRPGAAPNAAGAAPSAPEAPAAPTLPEGASAAELREQRQKNCEVARERAGTLHGVATAVPHQCRRRTRVPGRCGSRRSPFEGSGGCPRLVRLTSLPKPVRRARR